MFELNKQFRFEAAHTLEREIDAAASRRIHGHSYRAEVGLRGMPDLQTGMMLDLSLFERALATARGGLDHRFLNEVPGLGPATMENLCAWIWRHLSDQLPNLYKVTVHRDSAGESCVYFGPGAGRP